MTRTAAVMLSLGAAVFVALLAWQGAGAVAATLAAAGWGLALVAAFHLVPLVIDAAAMAVLVAPPATFFDALRSRWAGESVNSLMPAGQIGGPVLMARHLAQRSTPMHEAAAAVTVSTTMQSVAQIAFALLGLTAFAAFSASQSAHAAHAMQVAALGASAVLAVAVGTFYYAQQRGLFGRFSRLLGKAFGASGTMQTAARADAIDDPGNQGLVGLHGAVGRIDPRRDPVRVGIDDMSRRRGDQPEVRECGEGGLGRVAASVLAIAAEWMAEQQGDVAMIAEQKVRMADQPGQDRLGVAVPPAP